MSRQNATVVAIAAALLAAVLGAVPGEPSAGPPRATRAPAVDSASSPSRAAPRVAGRASVRAAASRRRDDGRSDVDRGPAPLAVGFEPGLAAVFAGGVLRELTAGDLGFAVAAEPTPDRLAIERVAGGEQLAAAFTTRPASAREAAAGLGDEFVGTWVPVIVVHPSNPVASLDSDQLRELLRGVVDDWASIGGVSGAVRRILPPPGPRADLMARALVPGDSLDSVEAVSDPLERLRRVAGDPLAFTVVAMPLAERAGARMVALDRVRPDAGTVRLGQYRVGLPVHLIHGRDPDPRLRELVRAVRIGTFGTLVADELLPAR